MAISLDDPEDRLNEAHFFLHGMEASYHVAEPFRFHLNAFLRALKEVPQLIQMAIQNDVGLVAWFRPRLEALRTDPLVDYLFRTRDFIVHRRRLLPRSTAYIGGTEGRGLKYGISTCIDPMEDSDIAMKAYLLTVKSGGDLYEILRDDEDSLPCIKREWVLEDLPNRELAGLAAEAWSKVGQLVQDVRSQLGLPALDLSLSCRHASREYQVRMYDRAALRRLVEA